MKAIDWQVTATEGDARTGILRTRRSVIETPVFMPVGTQAAVKGVRFEWLEKELAAKKKEAAALHEDQAEEDRSGGAQRSGGARRGSVNGAPEKPGVPVSA